VTHPLLAAVAPVAAALGAEIVEGDDLCDRDIPLVWEGVVVGGFRPSPAPELHGALVRLMHDIERELGRPLANLSREDKQRAVRMLNERGAFTLRKAVEDVADALGVSRFTVYNYLNSAQPTAPGRG
jgi:DNA binding protein with HTH domain